MDESHKKMNIKNYQIEVALDPNAKDQQRFTNDEFIFSCITNIAFDKYKCDGTFEGEIDEKEIDLLLGKRALGGGKIPDDLISILENHNKSRNNKKVFYYFNNSTFERVNSFINDLQETFDNLSIDLSVIENKDWNFEWKKHFKPIEISPFEIIPSWEKNEYIKTQEIPIYINPAMAFGTGTHETTKLCIQLLTILHGKLKKEKCIEKINSVLDFGHGSGILGICASKLLNKNLHFYDIDQESYLNGLENIALNFDLKKGVSHLHVVKPKDKAALRSHKFDLIFANILLNILIQEKEFILSLLETNGYLILSGILNEEFEILIKHYDENHFELIKKDSINDWTGILLKRRG